ARAATVGRRTSRARPGRGAGRGQIPLLHCLGCLVEGETHDEHGCKSQRDPAGSVEPAGPVRSVRSAQRQTPVSVSSGRLPVLPPTWSTGRSILSIKVTSRLAIVGLSG